jgi:diguanylate cyclase (GGDEF)-like protein/PAS domain S-box-containing protein
MPNQAEANLSALIESTEDHIWSVDLNCRLVFFNRAFQRHVEQIYGVQVAVGMHPEDMFLPERAAPWRQLFKRALSEGPFRTEYPLLDGHTLEMAFNPIIADGKATGVSVFGKDITERKAAESALSVSPIKDASRQVTGCSAIARDLPPQKRDAELSRLQTAALEATANAVIITDYEGKIVWVNRAFTAKTGYSKEELLGKNPRLLKSGEQPEAYYADLWSTISSGKVWQSEIVNRRKDGTTYTEEMTITPVTLKLGSTIDTYFIAITQDVTERKRIEDDLYRSRELLQYILDTIPQRVFWKDRNSTYLGCNQAFATDAGLNNPAEVIGKNDFELAWSGTAERYRADDNLVMEKGTARLNYDETQSRPDGRLIWLRTSKLPLHDQEGKVTGIIGTYEDITERKQTEESLKFFRLLVDQSNDAIVVADPETLSMLDMNAQACSSLGYTREELLSMRISDIDPTIDEPARAKITESLRNSGLAIIQSTQRRKDGSTFPVEVSMKFVHLDRDYVVSAIRDISERMQMERALEEVNAKLRITLGVSEEQAREAIKLTELVDILQSCQTVEEAYQIIGDTLPKTLASFSGALCMTAPSRNMVETVAAWGGTNITEKVFSLDDCWALRRGKIHSVSNAASPLRCAHVRGSLAGGYLCVPLAAQGETLGVLCLENSVQFPSLFLGSPENQMETLARQANAVAERISLVLANLRVREVLRSQSNRDPLTGLFNRRFMEESLEREVRRAARNKESVALLMLDLDHFKLFNDTFGHQAGDVLLRGFGEFLSKETRGQDVACRYGGEEFLFVLTGATIGAASKRAELLREGLKHLTVRHAGQVLGKITVSIGVSAFPDHGATVEELVRAADKALYRAKEEGRDRIVVASPVNTTA